jgi:hypothetical protein
VFALRAGVALASKKLCVQLKRRAWDEGKQKDETIRLKE